MDINIKSEPDIFEDTVSESSEFLDEKPDEVNVATIADTNVEINQPQQAAGKNQTKKRNYSALKNCKEISKDKEMYEFTLYLKKRFLETFYQEGCSPRAIAKHCNSYKINVEEVNQFFGVAAKEAQHYVYQECDSLSFNNITEWLNYFQTSGISTKCNYESALVMNAIANNENLPDPETMNGVNFRAIYKFLSNALMGLPQKPLDEASAKFLSTEFQNLINEANTDEADNDVRNMKRKIEYSLVFNNTDHKFYNLDPLNIDHIQIEKCTNINCNNLKLKNIATMLKK